MAHVIEKGRDVTDDIPETDDLATVRSLDNSTIVNTKNADIHPDARMMRTGPAIWRNADYHKPVTVVGWQEVGGSWFARIVESTTKIPAEQIEFILGAATAPEQADVFTP